MVQSSSHSDMEKEMVEKKKTAKKKVTKKAATKKAVTKKKVRMGRPTKNIANLEKIENPDAETIRQIEVMSGLGMKTQDIAALLGVGRSKLWKQMEKDGTLANAYKKGVAKAGTKVTETAYQMATSGKFPAMTMFWLKVRMKWIEANKLEVDSNVKITFVTEVGQDGILRQSKEEMTHGKNNT